MVYQISKQRFQHKHHLPYPAHYWLLRKRLGLELLYQPRQHTTAKEKRNKTRICGREACSNQPCRNLEANT